MMQPKDRSSDVEFKLKEVACFMKHFRVQSHDGLALSIVRDLNRFLELGGDWHRIFDYLVELEAYAEKAATEDFVWQLVYARRAIKWGFAGQKKYEQASEHALIAAKHFEVICRLEPSVHNQCCRIAEYLSAANFIRQAPETDQRIRQVWQIYEHCHRLFGEIEDDKSNLYYEVARDLYVKMYIFGTKHGAPQDVSHDRLLKYVQFSIKQYEVQGNTDTLEMILIGYAELSDFSKFSYESEKERIDTALAWAESAIEKGAAKLQRPYTRLKGIVRKCEGASA